MKIIKTRKRTEIEISIAKLNFLLGHPCSKGGECVVEIMNVIKGINSTEDIKKIR